MKAFHRRPSVILIACMVFGLIVGLLCTQAAWAERPLLLYLNGLTWSSTTPSVIASNINTVKGRPFDGIIFNSANMHFMQAGNTATYTDFMNDFSAISQSSFNGSTKLYNFADVYVDRPGDFFDDTAWNACAARFGDFAKMCHDKGWKGICFDTEEYTVPKLFLWPDTQGTSNTFTQYVAKAKARGQQVMQSIIAQYPDITLLYTYGSAYFGRAVHDQWSDSQIKTGELRAAFMEGMWEARGTSAHVVDLGENYSNVVWADYDTNDAYGMCGYKVNKYDRTLGGYYNDYLPTGSRDAFMDTVSWNANVYDLDPNNGYAIRSNQSTQDQLTYSLRRTDDYAWYYAEQYDWMLASGGTVPPSGLVTAVTNAWNTASTRVPGTQSYQDTFQSDTVGGSAAGWTPNGGTWKVQSTTRGGSSTKVYRKTDTTNYWSLLNSASTPGGYLTWTDYSVQSWVRVVSAGGMAAISGRVKDVNNQYCFQIYETGGNRRWYMGVRVNGTWTQFTDALYNGWTLNTWVLMKMTFNGRTITCQISTDGTNFTTLGTFIDSSITAGSIAIEGWNSTVEFDDVTVTQGGLNLLANPGFESGSTGWSNWGNNTVVTSNYHSGTHSMQVGTGSGGCGQDITAVANARYTMSGWTKQTVDDGQSSIGVEFLDSGGTLIPNSQIDLISHGTDYNLHQIRFVAPSNAATIRVYLWKDTGTGYLYGDDIQLTRN